MKTGYFECRNCHKPLPRTKRNDHWFCSAACCAEYARNHGDYRERFHAEKVRWTERNCEYCGNVYFTNDYGNRGGQRTPRFCSTKCRVAHHRKGAPQTKKQSAGTNYQEPPKQQQKHTDFWYPHTNKYEAALEILGVSRNHTQAQLKRAWRDALFIVHPDRNPDDVNATWKAQRVNWAYEYLKTS